MKALRTIGLEKSVRFGWTSIYAGLLHLVFVPQIRVILLRLVGARIGHDSLIGNVEFENLYHYGFGRLFVGDECFIGDEVLLDVRGSIVLEDSVTLSNRVNILTHINVGYLNHPLQQVYPTKEARVTIRKGAYIGTAATILPGVTIGPMAVVGAGSVVTRDVPAHTVVAGVPAKPLKTLKFK